MFMPLFIARAGDRGRSRETVSVFDLRLWARDDVGDIGIDHCAGCIGLRPLVGGRAALLAFCRLLTLPVLPSSFLLAFAEA